ncbi:hypothetical protein H9638_05230 [Arthrobacter sp. Sa2BUA2]|uniref:DUF1257 domain-containing protein n=1 Tax=Arthrobacter pullicola TaxID=2762224 RepID=A0ABR8YGG5_9MICC|nr:hypothetical protein [Arthrobacter pullicola]MBD8043212.1 hypothetical protein [Arthrobacter pullicola]
MSVSLLLIPAAMAALPAAMSAAAAAMEKAVNPADDTAHFRVQTRMKDIGLLQLAIGDTGGVVRKAGPGRITAAWQEHVAMFTCGDDGVWAVHFDGPEASLEQAETILQDLDSAYARRVQSAVVQRLKERAGGANLQLQSETVEEDNTVTLVLNVRA